MWSPSSHGYSRELFRERGDPEFSFGSVGHLPLFVGRPISLLENDLPVPSHENGSSKMLPVGFAIYVCIFLFESLLRLDALAETVDAGKNQNRKNA